MLHWIAINQYESLGEIRMLGGDLDLHHGVMSQLTVRCG